MFKAFDMSDLGLLCFYLGVEVRQDASGIALRQTHYAKRILELGGMTAAIQPTPRWRSGSSSVVTARRRRSIPHNTGG